MRTSLAWEKIPEGGCPAAALRQRPDENLLARWGAGYQAGTMSGNSHWRGLRGTPTMRYLAVHKERFYARGG